jgi:membrane associated rhomboid family serine protease
VGIRCPEHSGKPQGVQRVTRGVQRAGHEGSGAVVTRALVALNVLVFLASVASGASLVNGIGGTIEQRLWLDGPDVANGEYWRLFTSMFVHYGIIHIGLNMWVLWLIGGPLEQRLGRARFLALYIVAGLAGSAGALLVTPNAATAGASGAIFGLFGAALVLERQGVLVFGGSIIGIIILNLVFTFSVSGISIGGHLGGFIGGILATLGLSRFGRGHAAYGRLGMVGAATLIGVGLLSVALAIWAAKTGTAL